MRMRGSNLGCRLREAASGGDNLEPIRATDPPYLRRRACRGGVQMMTNP
jgi:hypothetical protein